MKESSDKAIQRFSRSIDKEKLEDYLDSACDEKFDLLVAMMRDPDYAGKSLSFMAKKARITIAELQNIYMDGERQMALLRMSTKLGAIMEDVTEDARTTMESCSRCDGVGFLPFGENGTRPCPTCKGTKEVRRIGDKHSRDLVFQSAKLTGQSGPVVAIQQNFTGGDHRMETILQKTRQIVLEPKNE